MIGDVDPEDEWDDGDPLITKLDVIGRAIHSIRVVVAAGVPYDVSRERFRKADLRRRIAALMALDDTPLAAVAALQSLDDALDGIDP